MIGPKAAASLLLKYGTLEAILEARTDTISPTVAAQLRVFKDVVSMRGAEVSVTLPDTAPPNWRAGAERLRELGANNLADRVAARV